SVTFQPGSIFAVHLHTPTPGTGYGELIASGPVNISGATLSATFASFSTVGSTFTLIQNNSNAAINGFFTGLLEGAFYLTGGRRFSVSYVGGNGASLLLTDVTDTTPTLFAAGAGFGAVPVVNVYDVNGNLKASLIAFSPGFTGGVWVAVGDVNGDG